MSSERAFIQAQTALAAPPLTPEIKLFLASEVTPLWQATEAALEKNQLPPPYWAFAWAGGQALARHVLDNPQLVAGKTVLDFGAGSGIVAIAAAKAGARVTAAEPDPFAAAAIAMNAAANDVDINVETNDLLTKEPADWDAVLAGDMCYERPLADRLIPWLGLCVKRGTLVLLGDPGRAYLPKTGLEQVARHAVPTPLELEDRTIRDTVVWRMTAPQP